MNQPLSARIRFWRRTPLDGTAVLSTAALPPLFAILPARPQIRLHWTRAVEYLTDRYLAVTEEILYLLSGFWLGALHAATPGHGKTIAAAYIVGARGRPVDAVVLGVFVTLSHTFGIVAVAVLASLGAAHVVPARTEAYLALVTAVLVVTIGLWMVGNLWSALFPPRHTHGHDALGEHAHEHAAHTHGDAAHSHGGEPHTHGDAAHSHGGEPHTHGDTTHTHPVD